MQNRALENTIYVLAAGAFGVFLRWLQRQLAFDENGLCGPSVFNVIVPLFIIVTAFVLRRRIVKMLPLTRQPEGFGSLENKGRIYGFFRWLTGAVAVLGGVLVIRGSEIEKQVVLLRVLSVLAILAGVCFPLYLTMANREITEKKRDLICMLSLSPMLLFAAWLVYDYANNAINSVIWDYLIEVLAASSLLVAFFRLGGFAYGVVPWRKTIFWLQFAAFMSIVVLADGRDLGQQAIFLGCGLMLVLADFILLRKFEDKDLAELLREEEQKPKKPDGGFDRL